MNGISVDTIGKRLDRDEPRVGSARLAGVSVILDRAQGPRTLLIRRAERDGDTWSGQVAFPGGRMNDGDGSVLRTAIRETKEEVGVDLETDSNLIGYFGAFRTHTGEMDVVPAVFVLKRGVDVVLNGEVSSYKWVGLDAIQSPRAAMTFTFGTGPDRREMPAYRVDDYVVWGLTHRIIEALLKRI